MKKILIAILVLGLLALEGGLIVMAADTNLSQTMSSGTKSVGSAASATLGGLTVGYSVQTTTGSFDIDPQNAIGDGAKYDVTMAATNLATIGGVKVVAGSNGTVGTSGTYDGTYGVTDPVKRYGIKIAAGGAVGTATYQWRVDEGTWSTAAATAATVALEKGISVTFGTATYVVDDEWAFGADVFPYTSLTVTPGTITADSGVTTGMTAGTGGALTGLGATSDSKNLLTTEYYRGMGDYAQTESLSQSVHANSIAGAYSSVATITIL